MYIGVIETFSCTARLIQGHWRLPAGDVLLVVITKCNITFKKKDLFTYLDKLYLEIGKCHRKSSVRICKLVYIIVNKAKAGYIAAEYRIFWTKR